MSTHKIICGDCITAMHAIEGNSIDSCVTDPPYGLEFMGKDWDKFNALSFQQFTYQWATELYRVLKPGAHILVFGGTRTYHRMACAIEDTGFEVRDMIEWFYGSGFPKSLDISKEIDKIAGKEREVICPNPHQVGRTKCNKGCLAGYAGSIDSGSPTVIGRGCNITAPASEQAIQWGGWGTGLKPAHEPILLARKPLSESNVASNVLKWGVGGINLDGCRVTTNDSWGGITGAFGPVGQTVYGGGHQVIGGMHQQGRFPANLILDGEAGEMLDKQSGGLKSGDNKPHENKSFFSWKNSSKICTTVSKGDKGGASRFYYQAKASQSERWFYCTFCKLSYQIKNRDKHIHNAPSETRYKHLEFHPTQKPVQLIQYLIKLITPPNGILIDPFIGSGTALIAAEREQLNGIGIDSNQAYCNIAHQRIKEELKQTNLFEEKSSITIK